jgi:hypothetical protein
MIALCYIVDLETSMRQKLRDKELWLHVLRAIGELIDGKS